MPSTSIFESMRLTPQQRDAIDQAARDCFMAGTRVRLFGSRLDDARRGGDIDLLVETPVQLSPGDQVEQRNRFLTRLYRRLGEQKIDVLIVPAGLPDERPVIQAARREGRVISRVSA